jgi:hypothetical protein
MGGALGVFAAKAGESGLAGVDTTLTPVGVLEGGFEVTAAAVDEELELLDP